MPNPATPDIDRILRAIRTEASSRGSSHPIGSYGSEPLPGALYMTSHGLPRPDANHAADFLVLPLDVFLVEAYSKFLGRAPDAEGAAHYQRALLRGRLTRIEVLGRLAYSPEGRARKSSVPGLAPAFLLATAYRIPVAGPLLALLARLLRVPAHWQDRSVLEATALASGTWMKR